MFKPKDNKFWALYLKPEGVLLSPIPEPLIEKVIKYIRNLPKGVPYEDAKEDFDLVQIDCGNREKWKMQGMDAWTFMALAIKMGFMQGEGKEKG